MKFVSLLLAISFIAKAAAAPSGAGACPAGEAAPGGPHLTGSPGLVGALDGGGFVMTVGGVEVSDGEEITAPLDFDIVVTSTGAGFRGILIRVGGATGDQVTSNDLSAPAGACGDVGSATHSENSLKTTGSAIVSLDVDTPLNVDISVVVENEAAAGVSTFYYSSFQINAVAGDQVITIVPTASPVAETILPTTMAPVIEEEPVVETVPPRTMSPTTAAPTTMSPTPVDDDDSVESDFPSLVPTLENSIDDEESDAPSMVPVGTPSIESDPPSLMPVMQPSDTIISPPAEESGTTTPPAVESDKPSMTPVLQPTSAALTCRGAAAACSIALLTLFV